MLDEVEERFVTPVDVLEDENERTLPRDGFEEVAPRGEGCLPPPAGDLD
jgi:hypothetical protein